VRAGGPSDRAAARGQPTATTTPPRQRARARSPRPRVQHARSQRQRRRGPLTVYRSTAFTVSLPTSRRSPPTGSDRRTQGSTASRSSPRRRPSNAVPSSSSTSRTPSATR